MVGTARKTPAFVASLAAAAILAAGPATALSAAPAVPMIGVGTPFQLTVSKLGKAGFSPGRVPPYGECQDLACRGYTPLSCNTQKYCVWLWERGADQAQFVVETGPVRQRDGRYLQHAFRRLRPATLNDLRDQSYDLALHNGVYQRIEAPIPKPEPPGPLPLCSEVRNVMPCWIKPPSDQRPGKR